MSESDSHNYTLIPEAPKKHPQEDGNEDVIREKNIVFRAISSIRYVKNLVSSLAILTLYPLISEKEIANTSGDSLNLGTVLIYISAFIFLHTVFSYLIFYTTALAARVDSELLYLYL